MAATLRLLPRWTDRAFSDAFASWALFDPRHLPSFAAGPLGVPFHDRLLSLLTTGFNRRSFQAVPTLVELARRGRLDPAAAAAAAVGRHHAGTLDLKLLTYGLQRGLEEAFRGLWPTALAIGDAMCTVEKRSAQLGDLLRMLASLAHEVPAEAVEVPPGLRVPRGVPRLIEGP